MTNRANRIDAKTLEKVVDASYNIDLVEHALNYIKVQNNEIKAMKCRFKELTGEDIPLSVNEKKIMRESGDAINSILKIIKQGKYLKERCANGK